MKAKLLLVFFLVIFGWEATAQNWIWAKKGGSTAYDEGHGLFTDNAGNSFVTGEFSGTATFGTFTVTSAGINDVFVAKYDINGNAVWVKRAGGIASDYGWSIQADNSGNIIVTGSFSGIAIFDTYTITSLGSTDIFIAKYDSSGNVLWIRQGGGKMDDSGYGISGDNSGNIYVSGFIKDTASFGATNIVSAGVQDIFLAKYDSNGNNIWAIRAGGVQLDFSYGIITDSNGNSYITGLFSSTATFQSTNLISSGGQDVFYAKYDSNGNLIWVNKAGGTGFDLGTSIGIDPFGNCYITGYFNSSATFDSFNLVSSGQGDVFVIKTDNVGNVLWVQKAGGTGDDGGYGIIVDLLGNSYVSGVFKSIATFNTSQLVSAGSYDVFFAKYNTSGGLTGLKKAGSPGDDYGNAISIDGNSNSYLTGLFNSTASFGSNNLTSTGNADMYIAKIDSANVTDIQETSLDNSMGVFPNPFSKQAILQMDNFLNNGTLTISNCLGLEVKQIKNISGRAFNLQCDDLPSGLYILRLTEDVKVIAVKKVLITN